MKNLTFSSMAAARLRANKRQYVSLVLGIFLSVFLVSTLVLGVYGIYLAFLQQRYDKVGYLDMVVLNDVATQEQLEETGYFDQIGHVYVSGSVTEYNVYLGHYDNFGLELLNLAPLEGRMPQESGEIAMEKSALEVLGVECAIGDSLELSVTPLNGTSEKRSYTIVGFLPERSEHFAINDHIDLHQFPAIVTSSQEPPFYIGRVATHFLLGLAPGVSLDTGIQYGWDNHIFTDMYGLSITGEMVQFYNSGNLLEADEDMFNLILIALLLAASLLLSCGVGISGAMEGVLSKRREEIGVLRALGATRRQIRRMFGRENLILALVVSPLSIGISCGAVWVLSLFMPQSLTFGFRLWLLLPIAVFSILVILLSGYLPLVRASRLMPMSVIRDTAMLRRSKGVKYKKDCSPTRLISARQIRFNPTRQIGASLLVGLMLLCSGLFLAMLTNIRDYNAMNYPGFSINGDGYWRSTGHINTYLKPSLTKQSIQQLQGLKHIKSLSIGREMTVDVILEEVPRYAMTGRGTSDYSMLDDEAFREAMSYLGNDAAWYENNREKDRSEYLNFLKTYQIDGEAYTITLTTLELNDKNLDRLHSALESGKIDVNALNAGREVIVVAPKLWQKHDGNGGVYGWYSEEAVKNDPNGEGAHLIAWNDAFAPGQVLPILHLYQEDYETSEIHREDTSVTVGAVLSEDLGLINSFGSVAYLITTEQGLENMGLRMEGLSEIAIELDGVLTLEEEETLERQITAIARRNEGYSVLNQVERYREMAQKDRQQVLLFVALITLFFCVSVGMIVSAVTRQLNSEGRTIGMLRAVGADEKAILGCYSGIVTASVGGGLLIAMGLVGVYLILFLVNSLYYGYFRFSDLSRIGGMAAVILLMAAACWLACRFLLGKRIRSIISKSIIENIREL